MQHGDTVCRAVRRFSARHHGRRFRASRRTLRLSPSRLRTLFYQWRKLRSPAVFIPGHPFTAPAAFRVRRILPLAELVNASLAPGVVSLAAAYRALCSAATPGLPRYSRFVERLPRAVRLALKELHGARLAQARARLVEARLEKRLQRQAERLAAWQVQESARSLVPPTAQTSLPCPAEAQREAGVKGASAPSPARACCASSPSGKSSCHKPPADEH